MAQQPAASELRFLQEICDQLKAGVSEIGSVKASILSSQPGSPNKRPLSPPKHRGTASLPLWKNAPLTTLSASDYAAQANPNKRSLHLPKIEQRSQSPPGFWRKLAEQGERIAAKRASQDSQPLASAPSSRRASKEQQQQHLKPNSSARKTKSDMNGQLRSPDNIGEDGPGSQALDQSAVASSGATMAEAQAAFSKAMSAAQQALSSSSDSPAKESGKPADEAQPGGLLLQSLIRRVSASAQRLQELAEQGSVGAAASPALATPSQQLVGSLGLGSASSGISAHQEVQIGDQPLATPRDAAPVRVAAATDVAAKAQHSEGTGTQEGQASVAGAATEDEAGAVASGHDRELSEQSAASAQHQHIRQGSAKPAVLDRSPPSRQYSRQDSFKQPVDRPPPSRQYSRQDSFKLPAERAAPTRQYSRQDSFKQPEPPARSPPSRLSSQTDASSQPAAAAHDASGPYRQYSQQKSFKQPHDRPAPSRQYSRQDSFKQPAAGGREGSVPSRLYSRQQSSRQPQASSAIPVVSPTLTTLAEAGEKLTAAEEKPPMFTRAFSRARSHLRSASFAHGSSAQAHEPSEQPPAVTENQIAAAGGKSDAESEQLPAADAQAETVAEGGQQMTQGLQDMLRAESTALADTARGQALLSATVADQAGLQEVQQWRTSACACPSRGQTVFDDELGSPDQAKTVQQVADPEPLTQLSSHSSIAFEEGVAAEEDSLKTESVASLDA